MLAEDASYRVRLEGRAELLDKTRLRYRALKDMLGSLMWRRRLRRNEPLLREIIAVQPRVDEALGQVEKKARAEGWREDSDTLALAREVDELKNVVYRQMKKKLGPGAGYTFSERLTQLERLAVAGPRRVYPAERWKAALDALPAWLPEMRTLEQFGELLEALFKRPYLASQRLPFTVRELERLATLWPAGDEALASAWARVSVVDTTNGVQKLLRKRARRAPMKAPQNGPELVLRAEFWRNLALVKMREISTDYLAPALADAELLPTLRWLAAREGDVHAELDGLAATRAALIGLSAELSLAGRRGADPDFWERLLVQAQRADQSFASEPDFLALRDNVRLMLQITNGSTRRPLDARKNVRAVPATFAGMVSEMRARLLEKAG